MKRATAVLTIGAVFLAGLLAGAAATHLFYAKRLLVPGGPSRMMVELFEEKLRRELDLTPEQAREVDRILVRSHERADALRRDVFPRVRAIMDEAADEIEGVLNEQQKRRFRELRALQRERAEHFLLGPPGAMRRHGPPAEPFP
jgi:hypothetical protein